MAAYLFDSSGLAKCYINEIGSTWVRSLTAPALGHDLHILQIAEVEVVSAIVRRRRGGSLTAIAAAAALSQLRHDIRSEYIVLPISDHLIAAASLLAEQHELRANDALHLAAATAIHQLSTSTPKSTLIVVSADIELNAAARAMGLTVEDPNAHP